MNDHGTAWQRPGVSAVSLETQHTPGTPALTTRRGLLAQLISGLVALGALGAVFYGLNRTGWAERADSWVSEMGALAYVLFPLFYALCNVLLLPAGVLGVGAGYLFGLWPGFLLVLAGNVLAASAAFGISRYFLRGFVSGWIANRPQYSAFDRALGREGWKIVFLTQINPLSPTSLLNYLYGATCLSFRQTMLWITLGQAPGLFLYAYLGWVAQGPWAKVMASGHSDNAAASGGLGPAGGVWFWAGGLALTLLLTLYLRAFSQRVLRESLEQAAAEPETRVAEQPLAQ